MCVVVQHKEGTSAVIWVGAANMIPDHAWEPGTTINVDPLTFSVVKAKSAEREKGVPRP